MNREWKRLKSGIARSVRRNKETAKRSVVDDSDTSGLPGDQNHDGMIKEVGNLRDMEAGDPEGLAAGHDLAHVNDMEVDGPEYMDSEVAMPSSNMKRGSDVFLEDLEEGKKRIWIVKR